jgi:hypothetical protein
VAIRIAGARLVGRPAWSLRVLRERLTDESQRLSELRIGHLGVRASVELSVRMLPSAAVDTLRLLGLLGPYEHWATRTGWPCCCAARADCTTGGATRTRL